MLFNIAHRKIGKWLLDKDLLSIYKEILFSCALFVAVPFVRRGGVRTYGPEELTVVNFQLRESEAPAKGFR